MDHEDVEMYDVAIVGLGPVGLSATLLLAQRGFRVIAIDEKREAYPLPRAVHYDPDVSRLLDGLGLAEYMAEFSSATDTYEWQDAARQTLLKFRFAAAGDQGWPESTMFTQPSLEAQLRARALDFPGIETRRGTRVTGIRQLDNHVELELSVDDATETVQARYAIGSDGAKSFMRTAVGSPVTDLGFFYDWLICDIIPHEQREWVPDNLQLCDPARPTSVVNSGPGRRRFEFMRMPGDSAAFDSDDTSWELMAPWGITPQNARLERRALYTFQALWAERWRTGRVFLAGDSAHLMPPFFGQGMVSGMRDALNLVWKLDLVLHGVADDGLLDSYESERSAHVQHAIAMSVELGKVICETDPAAVAARDAHFLETGPDPRVALPPVPPERLGAGAFLGSPEAGVLGVHGRVGFADGTVDLLDRRTFGSFTLLIDGAEVDAASAISLASATPELGLVVVRILPARSPLRPADGGGVLTVTDEDSRYLPHLRAAGKHAQLIRPDFYVYGSAASRGELESLVEGLAVVLQLTG